MIVFTYPTREAAVAAAHDLTNRFRMDIGVWECDGHWSDPDARYLIQVPAERRHGPAVDGAVYVALDGES